MKKKPDPFDYAQQAGLRALEVTLTERQLQSLVVDAVTVASAAILFVPHEQTRSHQAACRIMKRFTDVLGTSRRRK